MGGHGGISGNSGNGGSGVDGSEIDGEIGGGLLSGVREREGNDEEVDSTTMEMIGGRGNKAGDRLVNSLHGMREMGREMARLGAEKLLSGLSGRDAGFVVAAGKQQSMLKFTYEKDIHPYLFQSWEFASFTSDRRFGWEERVAVDGVVGEVCTVAPARVGGVGMRGSTVASPGWDHVTGLWSPNDGVMTVFGGKGNRVGVTSIKTGGGGGGGGGGRQWSEMVTRSVLVTGGRGSGGRTGKMRGKITSMEVLRTRRMVLVGDSRGVVSVVV